jgi:hypothetical protein
MRRLSDGSAGRFVLATAWGGTQPLKPSCPISQPTKSRSTHGVSAMTTTTTDAAAACQMRWTKAGGPKTGLRDTRSVRAHYMLLPQLCRHPGVGLGADEVEQASLHYLSGLLIGSEARDGGPRRLSPRGRGLESDA